MAEPARDRGLARRPGLSVRTQLTLSYAALLVLVSLALIAVAALILRFIPEGNLVTTGGDFAPGRDDLIEVFLRYSAVALVGVTIVGLGGGWLLAGRMLRPLNRITEAARRARDGALDHRIRMPGRQNELAELADTFDEMLARLQRSAEEQRRFAANASHELRTPHAVVRTMLEVARADPAGRDIETLLSRIDEMNERSVVLTEALLDLAEADHHDRPLAPVDLDELVTEVVAEHGALAADAEVQVELELGAGPIRGDAPLLRQLIANLVQNAIAHNRTGGTVWITTIRADGGTVLDLGNTGDVVPPETVATLAEPFVRGRGRTRAPGERHVGSGLGLAIVSSIARAHDASLVLAARAGGGLQVRVEFPDGQRDAAAAGSPRS